MTDTHTVKRKRKDKTDMMKMFFVLLLFAANAAAFAREGGGPRAF
jgi:hypothetical protein